MGVRSKRRLNDPATVAVCTLIALVLVQLAWFPLPLGYWVRSLILGTLVAMLAMGMALVYRANRVVNFTQDQLGGVPNGFAASFILFWGWPYFLGLTAGLVLAVVTGLLVEFFLIRRFRNSPRLVLTVATLGIRQLLLLCTILVPRWWGQNLGQKKIPPPFDWRLDWSWSPWPFQDAGFFLNGHDLIAAIVAPVALAVVVLFLRFSRLGLAIRAAAERRDRAALLGIPVHRLNTVVWAVATTMSFLALFLKSGIEGVPFLGASSLIMLSQALAALVIGRLDDLVMVPLAAVALSMLSVGVEWRFGNPLAIYPAMGLVILIVLLMQPRSVLRRDTDVVASWSGSEEIRPLPAAVAEHSSVVTARAMLIAAGAMVVLLLPRVASVGLVTKTTAVFVFGMVGLSLVVLTGWAGQVSLGQMAFAGVGAAVATTCTTRWHVDVLLAIVAGGIAGGLAAFLVGLPALRLRGLYLAVTTLAFALAAENWLLNARFFGWFPRAEQGLGLNPLFGRLSLDTPTRFYYFALAVLVVTYLALRGVRRSRTGRVIIALRDNERAAQSYSVHPVRAKLTAFAVSGAVAGMAGAVYSHFLNSFSAAQYNVGASFEVFISAVVGGLGTLGGGLLGAVYLRGVQLISNPEWRLLATGGGVLLVLLILPGGLGSMWVKVRDVLARLLTRTPAAAPDHAVEGAA
jgi:branched-chain amino acid transport system permease protein